jgi:multiple sugar transport system substrate-binding protein
VADNDTSSTVNFSVAEHFLGMDKLVHQQAASAPLESGCKVNVKAVPWDKLWSYLQEVAKKSGLEDFSEVGTTWTGHFIDKGKLHELTPADIVTLGGKERFLSSVRRSTMLIDDKRAFAVPWLADTRVIYYWRDDLKKADVDEIGAFVTPEKMNETLAKLHEIGKPAWGAPTFQVNNTLHQIASWIWSKGGDFLDEKGGRTALLDPSALKGICQYFELYRYMPCDFDSLDAILDAFENHQTSVIINGPWYLMRLILGGATDDVLGNLGVALTPGPPFVGGSNLVIWNTASPSNKEAALTIIKHLTSPTQQKEISKRTGLLSVLEEVLSDAPYSTDSHYRVFAAALKLGKPFPTIPYWGSLEEHLLKAFGAVWEDLKARSDCDSVEDIVVCRLEPVVKRFDRLLRLV